ncbi:MAG: 50S ribosomal protein L28 [bacterium]
MSLQCVICSKKVTSGKTVSHSHKASLRRFLPNLQKIKIKLNNRVCTRYVCTRCIRSGKITKAT